MSTPSRVLVEWKGDRKFECSREGRPAILLDGDGFAGPTPPETLLAALASCVSVDVVDILGKRRTPVDSYNVEILGERVDAIPRRYKHIVINVSINGEGIERVHAERAIDLALNKYCTVKDSLDPDLPVEWTLTLNGASA